MRKNILITGSPKSGKSTLLRKLIAEIEPKVGFVTNEIRNETGRVGFEIEAHSHKKSVLAHIDFNTLHKVSKYFVNIENLESVLPEVLAFTEKDTLYLDEIGEMQLLSEQFKALVLKYLNSSNTCLATLSYVFEDQFIKSIKERKDIILIELSVETRDENEKFLRLLIKKIQKARAYASEPHRFTRNGADVELRSEHRVRSLSYSNGQWSCTCNFYGEYRVCSHVLAAEEIFMKRPDSDSPCGSMS